MVVVPSATSVTVPSAAIVATFSLLDVHVTVAPSIAVSVSSFTVAVSRPAAVPAKISVFVIPELLIVTEVVAAEPEPP